MLDEWVKRGQTEDPLVVLVNNFIPQSAEYQAEALERLDAVTKPRWVKGWGNKREEREGELFTNSAREEYKSF